MSGANGKDLKHRKEEFHFLNETVVERKNHKKLKNWLNVIFSGVLFGLAACGICIYVMWSVDKQNEEVREVSGETFTPKSNDETMVLSMDLSHWENEVKKSFVELRAREDESQAKIGAIWKNETDTMYIISEWFGKENTEECSVFFAGKKIGTAVLVSTDEKLGIAMWSMNARTIEQAIYINMKAVNILEKATCKEGDAVLVISMDSTKNIYYLLGKITASAKMNMEDGIFDLCTTDIAAFDGKSGFAVDEEVNLVGMMNSTVEKEKFQDFINVIRIQSIQKDIETIRDDKTRAILGIEGSNVTNNDSYRYGKNVSYGVWVSKVTEDSAAYKSGIMAGDVITGVGGYIIVDLQNLKDTLLDYSAGDVVEVKFLREEKNGYKEYTTQVTFE